MSKKVYVITNPEYSCLDCVIKVYLANSKEEAIEQFFEDNLELFSLYATLAEERYNEDDESEEWVSFENITMSIPQKQEIRREVLDWENYIIHEKELNEIN